MKSGIYKITNTINGYIYIGFSSDIEQRIKITKRNLKGHRHFNKYLQADWDRLGENKFTIEVIEECHEYELVNRKQYYMDILQPIYNILEKSFESNKYIPRSEIALINLRKASKTLHQSTVYRKKMEDVYKDPSFRKAQSDSKKKLYQDPAYQKLHADRMKKRSENPEWRKNVAKSNKKLAKNPEWIKAVKDGVKKRPQSWHENVTKAARNRSEEYREAFIDGIKKRSQNPEWRKNVAKSHKKLAKNPEWRKKNAEAGKKNSKNPAWRKAISDGLKSHYAKKKAAQQSVNQNVEGNLDFFGR